MDEALWSSRWPSNQEFGRHIQRFRGVLGLDLDRLATRAQLGLDTLTELESGQREPTLAEIQALAWGLGVQVWILFRLWEQRAFVSQP